MDKRSKDFYLRKNCKLHEHDWNEQIFKVRVQKKREFWFFSKNSTRFKMTTIWANFPLTNTHVQLLAVVVLWQEILAECQLASWLRQRFPCALLWFCVWNPAETRSGLVLFSTAVGKFWVIKREDLEEVQVYLQLRSADFPPSFERRGRIVHNNFELASQQVQLTIFQLLGQLHEIFLFPFLLLLHSTEFFFFVAQFLNEKCVCEINLHSSKKKESQKLKKAKKRKFQQMKPRTAKRNQRKVIEMYRLTSSKFLKAFKQEQVYFYREGR